LKKVAIVFPHVKRYGGYSRIRRKEEVRDYRRSVKSIEMRRLYAMKHHLQR